MGCRTVRGSTKTILQIKFYENPPENDQLNTSKAKNLINNTKQNELFIFFYY